MQTKSYAILSDLQEKFIGEHLKIFGYNGMKYYIMYRLIIETGIFYEQAISLHVSDVEHPKTIVIPENKGQNSITIHPSDQLQLEIKDFIKNRDKKEWLFLAADEKSRMAVIAFQYALRQTQQKLALRHPLSINALRKTYFYHCYQRYKMHGKYIDMGCEFLEIHTEQWVKEYIGLCEPSETSKKKKNTNSVPDRQFLYENNYGITYLSDIANRINDIASLLKNPFLSDQECSKILSLIGNLEDIFTVYDEEGK